MAKLVEECQIGPKNPANQTPAEIVEKVSVSFAANINLGPDPGSFWYLARYAMASNF